MKIRCFLLWLSTVEVGNQDEKKLCLFTVKMFAQSVYCNDIDINTIAYWAFPSIYGNFDSQLNCKTGK